MAGAFPGAVTAYTNPGPADHLGDEIATRRHDELHSDNNDDLEAVQTKLGTGASTPSANTVLRGTGAGTTAFGQIVAADITSNTLTATQIAPDAIGASELADGAVDTPNIVAHATSQMQVAYGSTANPSTAATTSGAAPVLAQMTVTMTTTGGDVLISFSGHFQHATSAVAANAELRIDGVVWEARATYLPTVGQSFLFPLNVGIPGPDIPGGPGSHTFAIYFYGSAANLVSPGIARTLTVLELKR